MRYFNIIKILNNRLFEKINRLFLIYIKIIYNIIILKFNIFILINGEESNSESYIRSKNKFKILMFFLSFN
jgi:hypothetical protein